MSCVPQWSSKKIDCARKYSDELWTAPCIDRELAKLLIRFDHHTVWLDGRLALLRTYSWLSIPEKVWPTPLPISVSFTYAKGHPAAPQDVQDAVARLCFVLDRK